MPRARVSLVVLYTEHLEECRAFYAALGVPLVPEQHGTGPEHYAAELGKTVVELYPAAGRPTGRARLGLDVEAAETDPPLAPGRHLLTDPDGRTVDVLAH
ncbi:VOC family protein [Nocardiopsis salina]|uniref:glyoxalase/bleomycin resistance/dioxygenase family protein n=1 Tax=Nocardiopsis salina TaxID=245836 RepID=UPI0003457A37|nr:glyoxalase/bleomycin resistance/dioxygenase family protein [Nocardiopsis salina]